MSVLIRFQTLGAHVHLDVFIGEWRDLRSVIEPYVDIEERVVGNL